MTVFALCSFVSNNAVIQEDVVTTDAHLQVQGKHCNGTVGCDCSGFSAITGGEEWQKSYCKRCSHHKKCHR